MTSRQIEDFIRDNLPIVLVPGVPEIRLHKAAPDSGLNRLADIDAAGFGSPYWAYHWAGGLALARHVIDHPEIVAGKAVLDLGAGGGLVAIAAAIAGAARTIAAEVDAYGVAALRLNAALNQVELEIVAEDLTDGEPLAVDVVLVGDLFYAPELAVRVAAWLDRCLAAGQHILIGDPWRAHLPAVRLQELARYPVAETAYLSGKPAGVFAWRAPSIGFVAAPN